MIDEPWDGTDEEPAVVRRPAHRRRKPGRDRDADPAKAVPRERRRPAAIVFVAAGLVAAGFASGAVHPSGATSVAPPAAAANGGLPVVVGSSARSSAWYCPGPLLYGDGQQSSLLLVSSAGTAVSGRVTVTGSAGGPTNVPVVVPARASLRLPVSGAGTSGWVAASVLLDGGGVGVWQEVSGPLGSSTQSCQVTTSATWYLPAGSTATGADTLISLFNPTATAAVASLSFSSSFGVATGSAMSAPGAAAPAAPVTPSVFQGITVGAGQLVVVETGKQVQLRPELAATVTVTTGRLVAGEWSTTTLLRRVEGALVDASPAARAGWWFPLASGSAAPAASTGYWLYDPSPVPARVTILESLGAGSTASSAFVVPPASLVAVSPPPVAAPGAKGRRGPPIAGWAEVEVAGGGTVVAAQGLFPAASRGVGSVGFPQVSLGTPVAATTWLLAAPAAVLVPVQSGTRQKGSTSLGGTLWIAAPAASGASAPAASVVVSVLGTGGAGASAAVPLATVAVAPGTVQQVPLPATTGASPGGVLVSSSAPVVVAVGYADGSSAGGASGAPSTGTAVA